MPERTPLLRPMRADDLIRRPAPRPAPEEPEEPAVNELDRLLDSFLDVEDDEDDDLCPDAIPTERMPVPVCVPLYDEPRKRWWQRR